MRTALITGASRGIGRAVALRLARESWNLILLARSEQDLASVKEESERFGVECHAYSCDVTSEEDIENSLAKILALEEFASGSRTIDLAVLNAGVGKFDDLDDLTAADWDRMLSTNARGSFLVARSVTPAMKARGRGLLVFVTSDAARRTFATGSAYCASKFAQYGLASALRQELRPYGVRVTVIAPGLVASNFNDGDSDDPDKREWLQPADIAESVAYVADAPDHVLIDEIMLHPLCQEV